jgi:hypothetical protein
MPPRATLALLVASATLAACALLGNLGTITVVSDAEDGRSDAGLGDADATIRDAPGDVSLGDTAAPDGCARCISLPTTTGWIGPVELYEGPNPPPPCGVSYPTHVFEGGTDAVAPESCTCSCALNGPGCSPISFELYSDPACADPIAGSALIMDGGTCLTDYNSGEVALEFGPSTYGTSCTPQQAMNASPVRWGTNAAACLGETTAAGGCSGGTVCAPKLDVGFSSLCFYQQGGGSLACPPGYTTQIVDYSAVNDDRGCSSCTCGPLPTCGVLVRGYSAGNGCTLPSVFSTSAPGCQGFFGTASQDWAAFLEVPLQPNCEPAGGVPTGGVDPTGPVTFCCVSP